MDKKFMINITRTTFIDLASFEEAETIANLLALREQGALTENLVYVTTEVKELENAS